MIETQTSPRKLIAPWFGLLRSAAARWWRQSKTGAPPIAGDDPVDRDLDRATPFDIGQHGTPHGRAERADAAAAAAFARKVELLEGAYGPLPANFAWRDYLALNGLDDIHAAYGAIEHYLRRGRGEGLLYRRFDADLYKSLHLPAAALPQGAVLDHFRDIGQQAGLPATLADLVARHGLTATGWLERLDVGDFALLNAGWAGRITTKGEALDAMVREGFDRIAPIAFALDFDPAYYREANPGLSHLSPPLLYRQWLFEGMDGDRPGSAMEHLRRHGLKLGAFPKGFAWVRYRALRGVYGDTRWALLDHVVANNAIAATDIPVQGTGARAFLAALATTITDRLPERGAALFEAASRHGPLTPADEEQWGNALASQGHRGQAFGHYEKALQGGHPTIQAVVAAADIAGERGDSARAVQILRDARHAVGGDLRFRTAVRACIERAFQVAWIAAEKHYGAGRRSEGDDAMIAIVDQIALWWSMLDPTGVPVPPEPARRTVLLANVDLRQCTHYRVTQKQEIFAAAGLALEVFTQAEVDGFISALPGAAAALFYRLPALPMNVRAITVARDLGIPTYYDIDDLIFDPVHYPEPIGTYGAVTHGFYHTLALGVPLFRAAMALCDTAIASTTYLAERMRPIVRGGEAFVLPNGLDSRIQDYFQVRIPKVRRNDDVVLFYGSGTRAHNSDFLDLVGDALVTLMTRHANLRLTIAGYLSLDARFDAVRDRIVQVAWSTDLASYWSLLAEADIALAVLVPGATTEGKSEIKWLEAAAMGVASVVSATDRYAEVLTDGVEALFARTPDEWRTAIERLVIDPDYRESLVTAARAKAIAWYGLAANAGRVARLLQPAFADAARRDLPPPRSRKKRLLLVNIFFPPQTIGGSTRVARDNLDSILASSFAEECDVAVVTTDNDNPVPYQLRVDDYRGVPVFRMSTPIEANMEWRPFNPAIGAVFRRILDIWQPDLVHVHSIQRSTASILEECWAKAIPYVNTLHDAWWVADYHFMVDEGGRLREAEEALPLDPPPPASIGEALERRRRLRILLDHSAEILSVSDAFTSLHHKAGYPRIRCVANGIPPMATTIRSRSPSGRVRLAQISSQTHHKGYHLIQAALKQGRFRNLELTVIEHGRFGGRVEESFWGETPVRFVGKTKQEEMHIFYAGVDVLLCPSVWPESFGLVAREAIVAGLWVLASDRGAIGENVRPGLNGWVIDVATLEPLLAAFAEMDADPARFCQPPPRIDAVSRTADDQARDLIAIYRDVLARPAVDEPLPYFMRDGFALEAVKPPAGAMARPAMRPRWS